MNVTLLNEGLSDGLIFVTPSFRGRGPDSGPYIFDTSGTMVWSGIDVCAGAGVTDIQGLHVCLYLDQEHLCFWQGRQRNIHGRGVGVVMNRHYQVVKTVTLLDSTATVDLHEFRLTSINTAIFTTYSPRLYEGIWVLDSSFQEIDLDSNRAVFTWNALDHVTLSVSHVPRGSYLEVGDGLHHSSSWDYFHLNSVDKSKDGNYLISARHTDSIYAVSKRDGLILWQLGGDNSTFILQNFTIRRQHHVRYRAESATQTIISLFDNDDDGYTATGVESKGLFVAIDHENNTARVAKQFNFPIPGGHVSPSMGNVEQLPGGNVLVNWGAQSRMAEYSQDGSPIWSADLGLLSRSYRAFKSDWIGQPLQLPALYAAYDATSLSTRVYMSWNGATEVSSWRVYTSSSEIGPFSLVGETPKNGFETVFRHDGLLLWVFVQAMGERGILRQSKSLNTARSFLTDDEGAEAVTDSPPAATPQKAAGVLHTTRIPSGCGDRGSLWSYNGWGVWYYLEHLLALIGVVSCLTRGYNLKSARYSWH